MRQLVYKDDTKKELKRELDSLKEHMASVRKRMYDELNDNCLAYFNESFKSFVQNVNDIQSDDYHTKINLFKKQLDYFLNSLSKNHNNNWSKLMVKYDKEKQKQILDSCDLEVVKKSTHMHESYNV